MARSAGGQSLRGASLVGRAFIPFMREPALGTHRLRVLARRALADYISGVVTWRESRAARVVPLHRGRVRSRRNNRECVAPVTSIPPWQRCTARKRSEIARTFHSATPALPQEVAAAIAFLASEEAGLHDRLRNRRKRRHFYGPETGRPAC